MTGIEHQDAGTAGGGWQAAVERTVAGLGYDLLDLERGGRGLLRITIDRIPGRSYEPAGEFVTVEDCERVTRQLQFVLEGDGVAYERLEVSSPGLDRPLRRAADWERFAGESVAVTFKQPFEGRKVWKGRLARDEAVEGGWMLLLEEPPVRPSKPGARVSKARLAAAPPARTLNFTLDEVREARLLPVVDFKGRRPASAPSAGDGATPETETAPAENGPVRHAGEVK